ncbi:hypothetical protein SLEP1_g22926 [Rubroshorea leprosula]|uniref:Uncharacterized protein n=1 Tax=Rubroshorea leprosula TaxID=152421 RepID=A0AAV5JGU2_9ROSI|nr:hypothetical protein SLEP1_g22926 [Rubroshorea leprosula]
MLMGFGWRLSLNLSSQPYASFNIAGIAASGSGGQPFCAMLLVLTILLKPLHHVIKDSPFILTDVPASQGKNL